MRGVGFISEFGAGKMKAPFLPEVIDRVEACKKPVVAAVNGLAFGATFRARATPCPLE
jgi:enoyl-CoA hydratase/carnithine racemase